SRRIRWGWVRVRPMGLPIRSSALRIGRPVLRPGPVGTGLRFGEPPIAALRYPAVRTRLGFPEPPPDLLRFLRSPLPRLLRPFPGLPQQLVLMLLTRIADGVEHSAHVGRAGRLREAAGEFRFRGELALFVE